MTNFQPPADRPNPAASSVAAGTEPVYRGLPDKALDIPFLPDNQRTLLSWLIRQRTATLAALVAQVEQPVEQVVETLQGLIDQGFVQQLNPTDTQTTAIAPTVRRSMARLPGEIAQVLTSAEPIQVLISPQGSQSVTAGSRFELSVTLTNQGEKNALVELYLDEAASATAAPHVTQWCAAPYEHLALGNGQSSEVIFDIDVPRQVLADDYDYRLIIDSPNHYPEHTPIEFPLQLQVMPQFEQGLQVSDPTFSLQPATTAQQPVALPPGGQIELVLTVDNRANRVDRFRLHCPDLAPEWYTVRYPVGFNALGLVSDNDSLELNPYSQGQVYLTLKPPITALAGVYVATLQVYSANSPELAMLEALYLEVMPLYLMTAELQTLVGRVRQQPGLYWLRLNNDGNTPRQIQVQARSVDSIDSLDYRWSLPHQAQATGTATETAIERVGDAAPLIVVPPRQAAYVSLSVSPINQRRPWFGSGRGLPFVLSLSDRQALPLPQTMLQGTLTWLARPWWVLVLLILLGVGAIATLAIVIWLLLRPPAAPQVTTFEPESLNYEEANDDAVRLTWQISQPEQIQAIRLVGRSPDGEILSLPVTYNLQDGIPAPLAPFCVQQRQLICRNVLTDARKPGTYIFELGLISQPRTRRRANSNNSTAQQTDPVTVVPIPPPSLAAFGPSQSRYTQVIQIDSPPANPAPIALNWQIRAPRLLQQLRLIARDSDDVVVARQTYDLSQGLPDALADFCTWGDRITCQQLPTTLTEAGRYRIEIQGFTDSDGEPVFQQISDPIAIDRPQIPLEIDQLLVNGRPAQPNYVVTVRPGQAPIPLQISWQTSGDPDRQVSLNPTPGSVDPSGSITYFLSPQSGQDTLMLNVRDPQGQEVTQAITFSTVEQALSPFPSLPLPQIPSPPPRSVPIPPVPLQQLPTPPQPEPSRPPTPAPLEPDKQPPANF